MKKKDKDALTLYNLTKGLDEICRERKKDDVKIVSLAMVDQYHSYLSDYKALLSDGRLLDYKVPDTASNMSESGVRYYWLDDYRMAINQLHIHLRGNYDLIALLEGELIIDEQLKEKCCILFASNKNFDSIIREATTVLENRLREKAELEYSVDNKGIKLINKTLHHETGLLYVSENKTEREGIFHICRGIYLSFRDETHHAILENIDRDDAIKITLMIDEILKIICKSKKNEPTITAPASPNQSE